VEGLKEATASIQCMARHKNRQWDEGVWRSIDRSSAAAAFGDNNRTDTTAFQSSSVWLVDALRDDVRTGTHFRDRPSVQWGNTCFHRHGHRTGAAAVIKKERREEEQSVCE
jgi:hypothetical protein